MNWREYFAQIREKKIQSVYLFTGEEEYVKQSALEELRKILLPTGLEEMNEVLLEDTDARSVITAGETLPFMADRRLVVIKDFPCLMPGRVKGDTEDEAKQLIKWLDTVPDTSCMVFFMRNAFDARKKLAAHMIKMGAQVDFSYLEDADLDKWLTSRAKGYGNTIRSDAMHQLVFLAGHSLTRLSGEMDKLCAYAGKGKPITAEMVNSLVPPSLEATVFQMLDALTDQDTPKAFELLSTLLQNGEGRIGIIAMITRQMRLMTHMKLMLADKVPMQQIETRLGIRHTVAYHMEKTVRYYDLEQLTNGYKACIEADYSIKSGVARDEAALDRLLFILTNRKVNAS